MLELHYWEGLANAAIAALLELPVGTVASRIRLAKQTLLAQMQLRVEGDGDETVTLALDRWAQEVAQRIRSGG